MKSDDMDDLAVAKRDFVLQTLQAGLCGRFSSDDAAAVATVVCQIGSVCGHRSGCMAAATKHRCTRSKHTTFPETNVASGKSILLMESTPAPPAI